MILVSLAVRWTVALIQIPKHARHMIYTFPSVISIISTGDSSLCWLTLIQYMQDMWNIIFHGYQSYPQVILVSLAVRLTVTLFKNLQDLWYNILSLSVTSTGDSSLCWCKAIPVSVAVRLTLIKYLQYLWYIFHSYQSYPQVIPVFLRLCCCKANTDQILAGPVIDIL